MYYTTTSCYTCPNDTIAKNREEIEKLFGWRKMANGTIRPQARCRECRKRLHTIRRKLGLVRKRSTSKNLQSTLF